jgi:kynureninase
MTEIFSDAYAASRDAFDPLGDFRGEFHLPLHDGKPQAYFVGNSLGLQPKGARAHVEEVLDKWATQAVEGHFTGQAQWMPYHELVRDPLARVVGAQPREVVAMNSLTANLHLMLVTFYRPTRERPVLLMEAGAFPSDRYALESQLRFHGFDPAEALVEVVPDEADGTFSMAAIERAIAEHGSRLACIVWPGVQYRTGQAFDLEEIARLGHAAGAIVGFRSGPCSRQPAAAAARQRRRFRGLVPLQVHEFRPGRGRWMLRPRTPCAHRPPALRRLVGQRPGSCVSRWGQSSCPRPARTAGS